MLKLSPPKVFLKISNLILETYPPEVYLIKKVTPYSAKPPLKFHGGLFEIGLTLYMLNFSEEL